MFEKDAAHDLNEELAQLSVATDQITASSPRPEPTLSAPASVGTATAAIQLEPAECDKLA